MSEKSEKFAGQLERLIEQGDLLLSAIQYDCYPERFEEQMQKTEGKEKADEYLRLLPNFRLEYQAWYSEATAVVKQVLPDRLSDFVAYYEYPRARKAITFENYMIKDYLQGLQRSRFEKEIAGPSAAIPEFVQQLGIVKAAEKSLNSSLFEIRSILQADLFDSEIDSAEALAEAGFLRGAGAMCGVVIEKHLREVCDQHSIRVQKARPTISNLNDYLRKGDVLSVPQWRFIQHLADIRNACDHHRDREPTSDEIQDLVNGTRRVMKTVF